MYGSIVEWYGENYACPYSVTVPISPPAGGGGDGVPGSWGYYGADGPQVCWEYREGTYYSENGVDVVQGNIWVRTIDPIILDLDGNGINYRAGEYVHDYIGADGRNESLRWAPPGDGVLVYDWNRDGVGQSEEWALVSFVSGARTDLEALRAFDTSGNGIFDAGDSAYADFRIGIDANGDGRFGAGELHSLNDVGVASINLTPSSHSHGAEIVPGVFLNEAGSFTRTNGQTGLFHSVGLEAKQSIQLVHNDGFAGILNQGTVNSFVAQTDMPLSVDLRWYSYAGRSFVDLLAGGGNDYIVGTDADNVLSGGAGVDQIHALGGDDFILADAGDILYGLIRGGTGTDVLQLTEAVGTTVYAVHHEVEAILGSAGDDVLSGDGLNGVVLDGGKGNDSLYGSSGNDVLIRSEGAYEGMWGGAGDDLYLVDCFDSGTTSGANRTWIWDSNGTDTIFITDMTRAELQIGRNSNNLYLFLKDGSSLNLIDAFWGASPDVVRFGDGTSVSVADLVQEYYDYWDAPVWDPSSDLAGLTMNTAGSGYAGAYSEYS